MRETANSEPEARPTSRSASRFLANRAWLGFAIGAIGGIADTSLFLWLGIDFVVAGRDMTTFVAVYLAISFAALGYVVGHLQDTRTRARRDAETIDAQMRALARSQRAAAQNEKMAAIGRLAAGVAHEVRNPLGVIRASAAMVQESFEPPDEAHRACDFICDEIDRLNGLITSLLTFSRPAEPRLTSVDLDKVIDRALQVTARPLEAAGVCVERNTLGNPGPLRADPDLLCQLVIGLITNANEELDSGGRIELRVTGRGDAVELDVADSGRGIEGSDAERIFEPFYTTKASGTGLGLSMTLRIIEAHAGEIAVLQGHGAGSDGSGACFRVRLPVDAAPMPARELESSATRNLPGDVNA